jgi:ubiquinone/menaquinone biosynthesis C-methylase UbiE
MTIVDVGCGLGHNMQLIADSLPCRFSKIEGIDWSPATIETHLANSKSIYTKVKLCDSTQLPYADKTFDIALSMENLEHLYENRAIAAIKEMARIAKYLVITTPLPFDCINFNWLYPELVEAIRDTVPLSHRDFICLESAVHKSTLFPSSLQEAGFEIYANFHGPYFHGLYFGQTEVIDVSKIQCIGIPEYPMIDEGGYSMLYIQLLANSVVLHKDIVAHPLYSEPSSIKIYITRCIAFIRRCIRFVKSKIFFWK